MQQQRHWAEVAAEELLLGLGWRLLARNYSLRGGELDLVFYDDDDSVVFVEVRQRASEAFGGPAASIDGRKLARLRRTAAHFLAYGLPAARASAIDDDPRAFVPGREPRVRFDAVLVTGAERHHATRHLKDIA